MERLTEIKTHVTGFSYTDKKEGIFAQNVYAKLAAYEDTGLTPEQVEAQQQENEQLQEFANAKAEGRLVKRGKWIYEHEWKCSSCGWAQSHDFNTIPNDILKYCPNCGAKMSKEEAERDYEYEDYGFGHDFSYPIIYGADWRDRNEP